MNRFTGKNVMITGSSAGVGQIMALEFAKEGANLFLVNRSKPEETMAMIKAETGADCGYTLCDIADEQSIIEMGKAAGVYFGGKIDVLVNNAGYNGKASLVKDMKLDDWAYTIQVNLTGTMLVCREIAPYMIQNKSGVIMNTSSNVARRGLPYRSDYVCSKWALLGFTQSLALELVSYNIRVNAVCPGPIVGERIEQLVNMHAEAENLTFEDMHKSWEDVPMKRFVTPQEVANTVKFLCSDDSSATTGQALNVTGGFIMT